MPRLSNARMEAFAFALASGQTQQAAGKEAGYSPLASSLSRLASSAKIVVRVAEIRQQMTMASIVSVADVTRNLLDLAATATALARTDGAAAVSAARGCWDSIAKINGMIVEKVDARHVHANAKPEELTDEQLAAAIAVERDRIAANGSAKPH